MSPVPPGCSSALRHVGVMQDEINKIERDDTRKSLNEIVKQFLQIAMRGDDPGNLQERLVLTV